MGNLYSLFEESEETPLSNCPFCNKPVFKDRYLYSDLKCSQCEKPSNEYYHPECWRTYREMYASDKFVCYACCLKASPDTNV